MTIIITFSFKWYGFLLPRISVNGPALAVMWLGVSLAVVQEVAGGIVTPEQILASEYARIQRNNKRGN